MFLSSYLFLYLYIYLFLNIAVYMLMTYQLHNSNLPQDLAIDFFFKFHKATNLLLEETLASFSQDKTPAVPHKRQHSPF